MTKTGYKYASRKNPGINFSGFKQAGGPPAGTQSKDNL